MPDPARWAFPDEMQPRPETLRFDLDAALDAVVALRAEIPEDAFTAGTLGTERTGSAVAIRDDGLLLTIGYLVTEAETVWLTTNAGRVVPGHPLAYDQATGFGLVQALGRLGVKALARGTASALAAGERVIVAGRGGRSHALAATLFAKREFAGYWEYVLDEALFTIPAHPEWSGAALLDADGRLAGIGSLFVEERVDRRAVEANMFVPIDLLEPILDDLLTKGRATRPPRAWLGLYAGETEDGIVVRGLATGGPAARARVRERDVVLEVAGERVAGLADLFRRVWRLGPPGSAIPLTLLRRGARVRLEIQSGDRADFLRRPKLH